MKTSWISRLLTCAVFLVLIAGPVVCGGQTADTANEDWTEYLKASNPPPPAALSELSPFELAVFMEFRAMARKEAGLAFIAKHPTDPRRWTIISGFQPSAPRFVTEWASPDSINNLVKATDHVAAAAWAAQVRTLKAQMASAPDLPAPLRQERANQNMLTPLIAALQASQKGMKPDLPALKQQLTDQIAADPTNGASGNGLYYYMILFEREHPDQMQAEYQTFADSPSARVRQMALAKVRLYDFLKAPLEIKFTAVDGRPVDLSQLRGKVVLVDFWATWCGPCVAELPNVKRAYDAYHDKGFEVVGISLDRAPDRQKLIDFTQAHGMPWPQYYDGKYWQNEISTRYGIQAIPAMFLVDQNGMVVSTNARGPKLEAELKRLLNL
jgi:thiol-disulfide isomerase/thioredoxin